MIAAFSDFSGGEASTPPATTSTEVNRGDSSAPTPPRYHARGELTPHPLPRIYFPDLFGPWRTPPVVCAWCQALTGWMPGPCDQVLGTPSHGVCLDCSAKLLREEGLLRDSSGFFSAAGSLRAAWVPGMRCVGWIGSPGVASGLGTGVGLGWCAGFWPLAHFGGLCHE
jgi:hypothetical protein